MKTNKNLFSWSFTRDSVFATCLRKYYFSYYASWKGWEENAPEPVKHAYLLKKMTNLPMWTGAIVHEVIRKYLGAVESGSKPDVAWARGLATAMLETGWQQSRTAQWAQNPNDAVMLREHYFREPLAGQVLATYVDLVYKSIENVLGSPFMEAVCATPGDWKAVEKLEKFPLHGTHVTVKCDLVTEQAGAVTIVDWKTGADGKGHEAQLLVYALAAKHIRGVDPRDIRLVAFHTATGELQESAPAAEALAKLEVSIKKRMEAMAGCVVGGSLEANEPLPAAAFPVTSDLSACRSCPFLALCRAELEKLEDWYFQKAVGGTA
jgi:hypothetical protein